MNKLAYVDWWDWRWTSGVLCTVGLFKEFQPSEPFLVDYAVEFRNFTASQMVHEILPVTTYGYVVSLSILVLITDFLRYKPIIILGGLASVTCWSLTIWLYSTPWQAQLRQVIDAIALSTEIAYVTYMYTNVDRSHYRQVTSYSHSALHLGRFLGGIVGQMVLSWHILDLDIAGLNYLTLAGVSTSLIVSLFLPTVKKSIYFDTRFSVISTFSGFASTSSSQEAQTPRPISPDARNGSGNVENFRNNDLIAAHKFGRKMAMALPKPKQVGFKKRIIRASRALGRDFKIAYTNRYVLKWSLWWSIAQAIYLQVGIYAEPLWKEIEEETHASIYNGLIDACHALLSAILGIAVVFLRFPMQKWGEIYLTSISFIQALVLLWMSQTHHLYVAYGCYIVFQTLFQVVIIIATAEVAESIKEDSEAFIFGLNTLLALIIQTILTYAVADESGFDLEIRTEFVVYAAYLGILGVIFFLIAIQGRTRHWEIETTTVVDENNFSPNDRNYDGKNGVNGGDDKATPTKQSPAATYTMRQTSVDSLPNYQSDPVSPI